MIELLIRLQAWSAQVPWYKTIKRIAIVGLIALIGLVVYLEVSDERLEGGLSNSNSGYNTNFESVDSYKREVMQMPESKERDDFIQMIDTAMTEDLEVDDSEFTAIHQAYIKLTDNVDASPTDNR